MRAAIDPRRLLRISLSSVLLLLAPAALAAPDCPSACQEAIDACEQLDKATGRLTQILQTNLAFISKLEASQTSKRLKASSNVRIAEKRIAEARARRDEMDQARKKPECGPCAKS